MDVEAAFAEPMDERLAIIVVSEIKPATAFFNLFILNDLLV
jgi:hypothetical protein